MIKRRAPLLLSLAFFLSSLAVYNQIHHRFSAPSPSPQVVALESAPAQEQEMQVQGVWEQYSVGADGERYFMARLDIRPDGLHYLATPTEIADDVFPKQTYRSYDHSFRAGVWTFREAWDNGEVGEFVLQRQENGEYLGSAYLAGCSHERFATVFVKISD